MRAGLVVDVEHLEIEIRAARADADHQAPLRNVIEHADPVRELRRVMERQHERARREADALRAQEGLGEQQVRRRARLRRHHVVLADPRFGKAGAIEKLECVEVVVVTVVKRTMLRMRRHHERAEFHVG
nr:hypothetical protein [Burkholderia ubonensis]